jgi:HlyD family secretion protein
MDRKLKKKRFPPKRIAAVLVVLTFVSSVTYMIFFGDKMSKLNVDVEKITISEVTQGHFLEYINQAGNVVPIMTQYLTAVEGGRVIKKFAEPGDYLEKGAPIIELENTNLEMQIMMRESEFTEAKNRLRQTQLQIDQNTLRAKESMIRTDYQLRQTKREYERQSELIKKNATTQQTFEDAKYNYEYNENLKSQMVENLRLDSLYRTGQLREMAASIATMEENLAFVQQKLKNLVLRAPVAGLLTVLTAELGESKGQGQALGRIDVTSGFKIRMNPDEHWLPRIVLGLPGTFSLTNSSEKYTCKVGKIDPMVTGGSFMVEVFFDEEPPGIRNGQTIRVNLELGSPAEAILLPRGGFFQSTGGQWVYIVDPSGDFAIQKNVKIGRYNPLVYEVIEGLSPGDKVITSPYENYGEIEKLILKNNSNN